MSPRSRQIIDLLGIIPLIPPPMSTPQHTATESITAWAMPEQKKAVLAYQIAYSCRDGSDKVYIPMLTFKSAGIATRSVRADEEGSDFTADELFYDIILCCYYGRREALVKEMRRGRGLLTAIDTMSYTEKMSRRFSADLIASPSGGVRAREHSGGAGTGLFLADINMCVRELSQEKIDKGYCSVVDAHRFPPDGTNRDITMRDATSLITDALQPGERTQWNVSNAEYAGARNLHHRLLSGFNVTNDLFSVALDLLAVMEVQGANSIARGTPFPITRKPAERPKPVPQIPPAAQHDSPRTLLEL